MPQIQLPIFPAGSVEINRDLACRTEAEQVVYYNGHLPVFTHAKSDLASFRLFTGQLILQGSATQGQVAKAFGVPLVAIKRATKVYRHRGAAGFFVPKARRQGTKLNAVKLEEARAWLVQGEPLAVVSRRTGVLTDTLRKAIEAGRLPPVKKRDEMVGAPMVQPPVDIQPVVRAVNTEPSEADSKPKASPNGWSPAPRPGQSTTLSERSLADSQAPMGYGTTRTLERVLASCGLLLSVGLEFVTAEDVPQGGVLCALPALLTEGLLKHTRSLYRLPPGYYPLESLFLYLALLALVRCRSIEQTRYESPGEWGKLLGLDRLPEVRTLREKIGILCGKEGQAAQWQSRLAKEWMEGVGGDDTEKVGLGLFYVDGHTRVYSGSLGPLPRLYVARQKLCLRGTTDYWVNGLGGEPFFVVTQPIHEGLIAALRDQVIPRLLADAPELDPAQRDSDPQAMRFTVIFDREGFSPKLFADLKEQRIGILTYHKYPGQNWPDQEFSTRTVRLHTGEEVERELAERGTQLSNGLWVQEVRVRSSDGKQVSMLSTNLKLDLIRIAAWLPARWSQENFLKYMREHFDLDRVIEHGTLPLPETTQVVNPARRQLEQQIRRERGGLQRLAARFGAHTLPEGATTEQVQAFEQEGGQLREKIQGQTALIEQLKGKRQQITRKVTLRELPEAQRYRQLCPESKHFIDTIKMIAYRAESALAGEVREHLQREDDARALLRRVFVTPANLRPDYEQKTLLVELHRLGSPLQDAAVAKLCEELTATETRFPTTDLRLIYRQVGSA